MTRGAERAPCLTSSRFGPAARQSLPALAGHDATVELAIFNLLNLIRRDWGLYRVPNTFLLQQVGQTAGTVATSQPVFVFDPNWQPYSAANAESAYQLQLALRYRF